MKYLLMLIITTTVYSQIEKETHYKVSNELLKIHHISGDDLILYGSDGAILRSNNSGGSWKQNFSGTHDDIVGVRNYMGGLIAVTQNADLMFSQDKGNTWDIKRRVIDEIISDIAVYNDIIYLSSSNKIFISSDEGDSWQGNTLFTSLNIKNIEIIYDKIFSESTQGIYISDLDVNDTENFLLTNTGKLKIIDEELYICEEKRIVKVDENLERSEISFDQEIVDFALINDDYYLINQNDDLEKLQIFKFNSSVLDTVYNDKVDGLYDDNYTHIDSYYFDNKLFITNINKTIIKSENEGKNWDLISSLSPTVSPNNIHPLDRNNLFNLNRGIFKSDNKGATFAYTGINGTDTINSVPQPNFIRDIYFSSLDTLFWTFLLTYNGYHLGYSFDGGKTVKYSENSDFNRNGFISFEKELYSQHERFYPNESRRDLEIIKTNLETMNAEKIVTFDSVSGLMNYVFIDSSSLILRIKREFKNDIDGKISDSLIFFKTDINFSSIDTLFTLVDEKISNSTMMVSEDYLINHSVFKNGKNIFSEYNLITDEYREFDSINIDRFRSYDGKFTREDTLYYYDTLSISWENGTFADGRFINAEYKPEKNMFDFTSLGDVDGFLAPIRAKFDQTMFFIGDGLWVPIDGERLIKSVESQIEEAPVVWTYSPYPNPTTDFAKIKVYSSRPQIINNIRIELVEIGSGISQEINQFEISNLQGYFFEFKIDLSKYQNGAYILNFELDNRQDSEVVIIN